MKLSKVDLARKIAKALRHEPETLDLDLDQEGWASIQQIQNGFDRYTPYEVTIDRITKSLTESNYGRFEYDEEKERVRALSGHSTSQVSYQAVEPEHKSYFLVEPSRYHQDILEFGIDQSTKRYTQIFPSYIEALKDGKKRGIQDPCMVVIQADEAYHDGTVFYKHDEKWYIEEVGPFHLRLEDDVEYMNHMEEEKGD